ncbi:MAG: hypothetical protein MUE52_11175 [Tabrizicola sp.]|jgi:hypothetical protein|nr:hypothetical protein [Tabrizicola sp.]
MRNGLVDYSRLIAALAIVWFHTTAPGYMAAYAALPFFLVLLAISVRISPAERARRLLMPFLIWSAVYGLQFISDAIQRGEDLFGWVRPKMLVMGTSDHLWFLPYAFVAGLAAPYLMRWRLAILLPVLAAGILALIGDTPRFPFYQWGFGLVPVLIGMVYIRSGLLALVPLVAAYVVLELFRPSPDNLVILVGSALAIAVLSLRLPPTALSAWSARVSMWVYLGHILAVSQLKAAGFTGAPLVIWSMAISLFLAVCIDLTQQRLGLKRS